MMKKAFLLFYLLQALFTLTARAQEESDTTVKDSLLNAYTAMPNDTTRIKVLYDAFRQHIGQVWSIELLDTLLPASVQLKYAEGELHALLGYCDYYTYQSDVSHMNLWFEELEKASTKHKKYDLYFSKWRIISDYKIKRGETEAVMLEAEAVKKKAAKMNEKSGVFYANLTIATALDMAERFEEALTVYEEIFADERLNKYERSEAYWIASKTDLKIGKPQEAVEKINNSMELLTAYYKENKNKAPNTDKLLEKELGLCRIYARIGDTTNLLNHLNRAEYYYTPQSYPSLKLSYHNHWTQYYALKEEWEESLRMYDITFSLFDGTMPLYEMSLYIDKAGVLFNAGRYKESAACYQHAALLNDSINKTILQSHEEAYQANYVINEALIEKANIERRLYFLRITLYTVLFLCFSMLFIRVIHINTRLKRLKEKIYELLKLAKTRNKNKEDFLRTITHKIRTPLNAVVGFSEILANEERLTDEEKQVAITNIKEEAEALSNLILDILYLARLESGMMRFEIEKQDVVVLCQEAIDNVDAKRNEHRAIRFNTTETNLTAKVDSKHLVKLLISLLSPINEEEVSLTELSLAKENKDQFVLTTKHVLTETNEYKESMLQTNIHKAFTKQFAGDYTIDYQSKLRIISITLPINALR